MPSPSISTAATTTYSYTRPWLYPKQTEAFFCPERYAITEAATKAGKTTAAMAWLFEQALFGAPHRNYWWVAPVYPQAKIAYRRLKSGMRTPQGDPVLTANDSELTLTLPTNQAVLWFKGSDKPDTLYGEDVYAAVLDEFTRVKEESWHAVRSTVTQTRGLMRFIGNVKGRRNWGYQLARRAEAGTTNMRYTRITAYDAVGAGIYDISDIEDAKAALPEHVFNELYLCIPADDGGNPFGIAAIEQQIAPLSDAEPVVYGIDFAKSTDWTVVIGLDVTGAVCRFDRWQGPWQETIRRIVAMVGQTPALVDSTGVGDPVLETLQANAANVYSGFKFSSTSKQQLMEGLAVAIQQHSITYPDGPIVSELQAFEYEYTRTGVKYSAPPGVHDDCVVALGLAVAHKAAIRTIPDFAPISLGHVSHWKR